MPIQAAIIHGSCTFLAILFIKKEEDILKKNKLLKIFIHIIFFLNVIGAIMPGSKVTIYFTVPALIIFLFFFRNEINFFFKKKLFIYFFIFIMIFFYFIATRWNGYNLYWSQIAKLTQFAFNEKLIQNKIFIPEQIIQNRSNYNAKMKILKFESYEKSKKRFEAEIFRNNSYKVYAARKFDSNQNFKINIVRKKQIQELLKIFGNINIYQLNNSTKKNSQSVAYSTFKNNFLFTMYYFTSGRLGVEPLEITLLKEVSPVFGFGPIFHINYDNFYYYTLFNGGYFSLTFFILGLIIIIYSIFKNKNFSKEKFFTVSYLMIFLIFLVSSIGAPSYLLNTAVIYFYLPTAIILFRKKTFDEFN